MAKVFGAEGSDFVSEEKKKNGSYLGKKRKGRDRFVSEWKRRKSCAYANAPSAAISSYKSVMGSPLDCRYAAVKGTPAAEEGYTPKPWFT